MTSTDDPDGVDENAESARVDVNDVESAQTETEADVESPRADAGDAGDTAGVRRKLEGRELAFHVAALVVATIVLASGLFAWWNASRDEEPTGLGDSRDAALIAARSEIETMNSLDYRNVDEGINAWGAVSTGVLHDQVAAITPAKKKLLAEQKKISVGKVVDAAVVDVTATTATVIASLEVTIQDDAVPDSEPTVKRNRFTADLSKVDGQWLLENVQQVAVTMS
ncbi:hypothetical protein ASG90_03890 [Nocardioides sp. Soil797]|nr:hypothetical protein ASG90_03890 [Nocardioides sp. Soil797]